MSRIISAVALAASLQARYPNALQEQGLTIHAGADSTTLDQVHAAGSVKGFAAISGSLQWVRANEHFLAGGELVMKDDYVQVQETDAKRLVNAGRAELATEEEVAAVQKKAAK